MHPYNGVSIAKINWDMYVFLLLWLYIVEVFIDDTSVPPQSEVTCTSGQFIKLGVSICNLSPTPLHQLTLIIQFYQDYQNGHLNYRLETRVTMSGPNQYVEFHFFLIL